MGGERARGILVRNLNRAFSARHIRESAAVIGRLSPRADFLDISMALGVLDHLQIRDFKRYRERLAIPQVIQRVLTQTYRASLLARPAPIPMEIEIKNGRSHSVRVKSEKALISVVLTRPDPTG